MSKILMHLNSISERGTTTAAIEYALELRKIGNEISFCYDLNETSSNAMFVENLGKEFPLFSYSDFQSFGKSQGVNHDYSYFLKSGEHDNKLIPGVQNYVHVVFQNYAPHGDRYAYVSEWLAKEMSRQNSNLDLKLFKWVPHIVDMPIPDRDLRKNLGIPNSAICGIRIGGQDSFDIQFVRDLVSDLCQRKYFFIFVNTEIFIQAPNVIFLKTIFDKQIKANLMASADYFLHARTRGESFGISIVEAIQMGLPVFAWEGGIDRNHIELLPSEWLYSDRTDLENKISECKNLTSNSFLKPAEAYRPASVMEKFLEVFPVT